MELVLHLLGVGPGDEVIVPAYTYTATASVTQHVGAKLVMVDSQKDSVEMDYDQLAAAITERTKVIVPVDIAGIVADYDRVYEIVEQKKGLFRASNALQKKIGRIIVSADCAHSFGGMRMGKMAPSKPEPANRQMISGAKSSTKQMRGKANMNSNLKATSV